MKKKDSYLIEHDNISKLKTITEILSHLEKFHSFHASRFNDTTGRYAKTDREAAAVKEAAQKWLQFELNLMAALYNVYGNPMFALRGLKVCFDGGLPVPAWVEKYTQQAITALLESAYNEAPGRAEHVLRDCLQFRVTAARGGSRNPFTNYTDKLEQAAKLTRYLEARLNSNSSYEALDAEVCKKLKIVPDTVKKWRLEALKLLDHLPKNLL